MTSQVIIGLWLVFLAGALEGLFSLGVTRTPKWKWENSWALGSLIALVVVPWPLALLTVPDLGGVYQSIPASKLLLTVLFGVGWRKNFECKTALDAETGAPLKFEAAGELEKGAKAFKLSEPLTAKKHEFRAIAVGAEE